MRTFTYLTLYGYLTDAVIVNRVFPEELDGTYFGAWRAVQQRELERVRDGFAPVPVRCAPYFEAEVLGGAMLDRLGDALFGEEDAAAVMHGGLAQEFSLRRRRRRGPARRAVRRQGRRLAQEGRRRAGGARGRAQAHRGAAAGRSRRSSRRARRSTTARWWCALPDEPDALREVRARLDDAHAAADRLVREAQRQAAESGPPPRPHVPPRGWATAGDPGAAPAPRPRPRGPARADRARARQRPRRALAAARRGRPGPPRSPCGRCSTTSIERLGAPAPGPAGVEVEDIPLDD